MATGKSMKIPYKLGGFHGKVIEHHRTKWWISHCHVWLLEVMFQYTECFWRHCKKLLQPLLNRIANCSLFWSPVSRQVQRWKTARAYISMRGVVATTFVAVNCWVLKSCLYPCELSFIHYKEFRKFNWCFTTQSRSVSNFPQKREVWTDPSSHHSSIDCKQPPALNKGRYSLREPKQKSLWWVGSLLSC